MAIFKDDSPKKVSLAVKILKFDSRMGLAINHTTARYEIIDVWRQLNVDQLS